VLEATGSYGQLTLACITGLRYSTQTITHARILYNTSDRTYGTYKLQVYCSNQPFSLDVVQHHDAALNSGWSNWTLITPTAEGTPSGWTEDSTARIDDLTSQSGQTTITSLSAHSLNLSSQLTVANGGTGRTTLTSDAVLVGNGTSAVSLVSRSGIDSRSTFPPSSHNHSAADITSGTLTVARGGTGVTSSTGSTSVVLSSSPTISTPRIATIYGGTASTSVLNLRSTTSTTTGSSYIRFYTSNSQERVRIIDSGYVGIGRTNPSYGLDVGTASGNAGSIRAYAYYYGSDKKLKKDIRPIKQALEKIKKIEGIKFKWKQNNEESIGLIAQDVEKVFPEIVNTPKNSHKSIQYGNLVAPIIEAIKELSNDFETVKKRLDLLEKKI
jgi:hypothetical protein